MWKTGDPEMPTPKRVRTFRPKHSDTSLSREWRINMANKEKPFKHFFFFILLSLLNWLHDVIICLVGLIQMFTTAAHNTSMKIFPKIATFLQNQFNKKLICDLISQLIFKFFQLINGHFKASPIVYNMYS